MKRYFISILFAFISVLCFGQVVSFDYSDTAMSADAVKAKVSNATKLIYPTSMKSKIPPMECKVKVDGLGPFSVSATTKVMFAPGNLQFNAAQGTHQCADGTTQKGTWRFAEHQWDYVGNDNSNVSETYNGWIDLFGWGTSGWNSGANAYQPWSTSQTNSDYYPGGNYENDLIGEYANADWGVYNQIGSDAPGTWRTLTYDEWNYVYSGRANASQLCGQATVNGVTGFVLLPDDWELPSGLSFTSGTSLNFTTNTYTISQWEQMEQRGAVFLPTGGYRYGSSVDYVGSGGYYWSVSQGSSYDAYYLYFGSGNSSMGNYNRDYGRSVRLSQDL